jgi:hypothetical protein
MLLNLKGYWANGSIERSDPRFSNTGVKYLFNIWKNGQDFVQYQTPY